jgi:hypothetical protein
MFLRLSSETGSAGAGLLIAVAVVGLGSVYISSDQAKLSRQLSADVQEREREAAKQATLNGINRFRSLLAERDLGGAQGPQPALYPADYFSAVWNLNRNAVIPTSGVNLNSQQVRMNMRYASSGLSIPQAVAIMSGTSQQTLQEGQQNFEILSTNYSAANSLAVESIDVRVTMPTAAGGTARETARLMLEAPEPKDMRVEISPQGTNSWSQTFTNLSPGYYDVRVVASGVVLQANVNLNGTAVPPLGVSQGPNRRIIHQARNVLAVDQEIGRFTYEFTSPRTCNPAPGDGLYTLHASLTKADGTLYNVPGISDGAGITIQVESQAVGQRYVGLGCYWMENYSGNYCWVPAPGWIGASGTIQDCKLLDSCSGGGGMSAGGCYKWANASDAPAFPWP